MIHTTKKSNNVSTRCGWEYLSGSYDLIDVPSTDNYIGDNHIGDNHIGNNHIDDNSIDQIEYLMTNNKNDPIKIYDEEIFSYEYSDKPLRYQSTSHNKKSYPVKKNNVKFYIKPSRSKYSNDHIDYVDRTHNGPVKKNYNKYVHKQIDYSKSNNPTQNVPYGSHRIVSDSAASGFDRGPAQYQNQKIYNKRYLNKNIIKTPSAEYFYNIGTHDVPICREYYKHNDKDQK